MQQNREVSVNWLRINVPQVVTIVGTGILVAMYVQSLASTVDNNENNRKTRALLVDKNFDSIDRQLQPLSNLPYRVNNLESGLTTTNQRIDQYLRTLGDKIDGVGDRMNGLSTKVEVLSQKIDALTPEKRSELQRDFQTTQR